MSSDKTKHDRQRDQKHQDVPTANPKVAIWCESSAIARQQYTAQLARQLSLPQVMQIASATYLLTVTDERLELREQTGHHKPLYVDFLNSAMNYRRNTGNDKNQLLAKAVGIKGAYRPEIVDATAGLGVDGFILACLGCQVHWLERAPLVAALLQDGLTRYRQCHTDLKLKLTVTNAITFLATIPNPPEVIYLDPMFPTRNKSALGKQNMRILQQLIGSDEDADNLLQVALRTAQKRVVVKRPRLAPVIAGHKPDIVFTGKSCRFDVYLSNHLVKTC